MSSGRISLPLMLIPNSLSELGFMAWVATIRTATPRFRRRIDERWQRQMLNVSRGPYLTTPSNHESSVTNHSLTFPLCAFASLREVFVFLFVSSCLCVRFHSRLFRVHSRLLLHTFNREAFDILR